MGDLVLKATAMESAFERAIEEKRVEIRAIVDNDDPPTFANTILALEGSGGALDRIEQLFTIFSSTASNDEIAATEAWKILQAESVPNVYILEGGLNNWLDTFASEENGILAIPASGEDRLRYTFAAALGGAYKSADPDPNHYEFEFTPKVKLDIPRGPSSGGCG